VAGEVGVECSDDGADGGDGAGLVTPDGGVPFIDEGAKSA